jgi:signal transduction histidine kinase/ligand-binding sensor domain-containing protein
MGPQVPPEPARVEFHRLDGLSHNTVHAIVQDHRGFLWFGTRDGLDRYDGHAIVSYKRDPVAPRSPSSNWITALVEDRAGVLWVGTASGLHRMDPQRSGFDAVAIGKLAVHRSAGSTSLDGSASVNQMAPSRPALSSDTDAELGGITALAEAPDGALWVGSERGLFFIDATRDRVSAVYTRPPTPRGQGSMIHSIRAGPDRSTWVLTQEAGEVSSTLYRLPAGAPRYGVDARAGSADLGLAIAGAERFSTPPALSFFFSSAGQLWVDLNGPLRPDRQLTDAANVGRQGRVRAEQRPRAPERDSHVATAFGEDPRGRVWIGTHEGLFMWDPAAPGGGQPVRVHTTAAGVRGLTDEVTGFLRDRAGTLWIATFGGVLRLDDRSSFIHLGHRTGDPDSVVQSPVSAIYRDASNALWIGTYGGGLDRIDLATGRVRHYRGPAPRGPCGDYIWALSGSSRGVLWAGTRDRLCELDSNGVFRAHALPVGLGDVLSVREWTGSDVLGVSHTSGVDAAPDPVVWLGTHAGLVEYRPRPAVAARVLGPDAGFSGLMDVVYADPDGTVWGASGGTGDLTRYDPIRRRSTVYPAVAEGIWDIHRDRRGTLWLATGSGLARFDEATGTATHVAPAPVQDAAPPLSQGSIYYSLLEDDDGRIWLGTNKGLVRVDTRRSPSPVVHHDVSANGGNSEFNRHAAFRSPDGRMYFGGMTGVTSFHPAEIGEAGDDPPVALTGVGVLGDEGERWLNPFALDRLTLSPRDRAIDLEFAALDFRAPLRHRYVYRLDGFDDDWVDGGTRRFARYTALRPGDYTFRVQVAGSRRTPNGSEALLAVTVLPPFWQTWWFRGVVAASLVTLLGLAYRVRVRRLIEVERMRLRIAGDLHDELGSELSAIALMSAMLGRHDYLEARDRERLADVESSTRRVMDGLREIVWCIDPEHDTLGSLAVRMRSAAARLLANVDHEFVTNLADSTRPVDMDVRRSLFLACKELVANAARHSGARRVEVRFAHEAGRLVLEVADDGVGLPEGGTREGRGLRAVRRRAALLGADLQIESRPGAGTRVRLVRPD